MWGGELFENAFKDSLSSGTLGWPGSMESVASHLHNLEGPVWLSPNSFLREAVPGSQDGLCVAACSPFSSLVSAGRRQCSSTRVRRTL